LSNVRVTLMNPEYPATPGRNMAAFFFLSRGFF